MISLPYLTAAINFYQSLGYKALSVPYIIDKEFIDLSFEGISKAYPPTNQYYVGSAEQSFFSLLPKLEDGAYMALTPCVRNDVEDETHQKIFLKLELCTIGPTTRNIQEDALIFFRSIGLYCKKVDCDLEYDGVELGSYGQRDFFSREYQYGTGLAEPRTSYVASKIKSQYSPGMDVDFMEALKAGLHLDSTTLAP
jgi:hypothetical protein